MIRQAIVALGPRSVLAGVLVGGAALALGALFVPRSIAAPGMYRLVLHAPEESGAIYLSAWNDLLTPGVVFVAHDGSNKQSVTFTRRGDEHDGCSWMGTEKLTPIGARAYAYSYEETILSCRPGALPFRKTPRTGIVTLERWDGAVTATALTGIQPPGDLWNVAENSDVDVDDEVEAAEAQQAIHDAEDLADNSATDDDE